MSAATDPKQTAAAAQDAAAKAAEAQAAADDAKAKEAEGLKEVGAPAMDFIARALNQTAKPKKEKKKAEVDPNDADPDDLEVEQLRKPAAKPKKAAAAAQPPAFAFDEEKLGAAVGRAVAAATKPKEDKPPTEELPELDQRRMAVLRQMETQYGERYKGLADRYVANLKKHKEYKAKWESEHPGEEYDEDAEEHADFLEPLERDIAYDEDDYVEALTDLKLSDRMKKVDEHVSKELAPLKQQEQFVEHRPKIIETRDKIGNRFWERMGDEFKDVLKEVEHKDGRKEIQINGEVLQELAKTDPDTHAVVVNAAKASESYAAEVYLLDHQLREFDPKNEMHQTLRAFVADREGALAAKPAQSTADEFGRVFLPRAQFNALPAERRQHYWTLTHEDIGNLMAARIAKATKAFLQAEEEKFARRAAARGVSLNGSSAPARNRKPPVGEEDDEPVTRKPVSPSSAIAPRLSPASIKVDAQPSGGIEGFLSRAFVKR